MIEISTCVAMNFEGKVILVTGSGSGIGAECAKHLAKLGGKIALVDCNEKNLNDVSEEFKTNGFSTPLVIVADVTKDGQRIIDETIQHFGKLNVLVNNAGIALLDNILEFNISDFDRVFNVNVRAVAILTNLAVPHLEKTKGNIVNVSSILGIKPINDTLSYAMSKSAINQFTKCCAKDLASKGIRVNAVNPGFISTPLYDKLGLPPSSRNGLLKYATKKTLVGHLGVVGDIARAIAYLAADTASFMNGILLPVEGGFLLA